MALRRGVATDTDRIGEPLTGVNIGVQAMEWQGDEAFEERRILDKDESIPATRPV